MDLQVIVGFITMILLALSIILGLENLKKHI